MKPVDYTKIDRLAREYRQAVDKAAYLAGIWGDLTHAEGTALLKEVESNDG